MNFKPLDKFLLILLSLCIIFVAAILIGSALSLINPDAVAYIISQIKSGTTASIISGLVGLVLLVLAFRMFIAMGSKAEPVRPTSALLASNEIGASYVALSAIDSMVQRKARENQKVKDCESRIIAVDDGVKVALRVCVHFETVVPTFVEELQNTLKEYIERMSGIKVKEIEVLIISAPLPPKTTVK